MEEFKNVEQLFEKLGAFLHSFESKSYLVWKDAPGCDIHEVDLIDYTYYIKEIASHIYSFSAEESMPIVSAYIRRVEDTIPNLERVQYQIDYEGGNHYWETKMDEDDGLYLLNKYKKELEFTLEHLKAFESVLFKQISQSSKINPVPVETKAATIIELPNEFTVTQLNKHFTPQLSVNQATLFLYYLRDLAILPPYSDASIGKLAEAFFVRNQKNITRGLTDIYSLKGDDEDLSTLKKVLQSMIKEIDKDLK